MLQDLEIVTDPVEAAKEAGLRYVNDQKPGITRKLRGKHFVYFLPDGKPLKVHNEIIRVRRLAVPPAYTDVWICPSENGHLQATGRDARGRKQYRYHQRWRTVRDENKYGRIIAFGEALPAIRARVKKHLSQPGLPREKVLATVVSLLEKTLIRVGNEEYAKDNKSYGLTTMRNRHVEISGAKVSFAFRGKSGKRHEIDLKDARLAKIVKKVRDLPGQELFQYVDEQGETKSVDSSDVNAYLREISGQDFTAKDFRTWSGTVLATTALRTLSTCETEAEGKKNIVQAVEAVSKLLGNTPAVCRKCYVHPVVFDSYLDGSLLAAIDGKPSAKLARACRKLKADELAVMMLLLQKAKSS